MRTLMPVLLILTSILEASGQEYKPLKWVAKTSFGYTTPITTLNKGHITDDLIGFESPTINWQFISSTYFFSKWGVEMSFSANYSSKLQNRHDRFANKIDERYLDNYFVSTGLYPEFSSHAITVDFIIKGSVGPVYKIERNRLIFISRAMIGFVSFKTDKGNSSLKTRGTNERININWATHNNISKESFAFNPSTTIGYRMFDRIIVGFDINYWIYNVEFGYRETITNFITNEIQINKYAYSDLINELGFGVSVMIVIK